MSTEKNVLNPVPIRTDHWLLSAGNSSKISGGSPEPLAQAFSDPDPTTMVVSGSEKDTSGGKVNSKVEKMTAASGGRRGYGTGNGNGEKIGNEVTKLSAPRMREFKVLTFCYEHGFITRRVVERLLLSDIERRSASRILERLVSSGRLYPLSGNWATDRGVFQLTRASAYAVADRANFRNQYSLGPIPRQFDHDVTVMEVRILLERLLGGRWQQERALRTAQWAEIPDGVLHLNSRARIAIEVELTQKNKPKLNRLLARWKRRDVSLVLYVCPNESMADFIKKQMKKIPDAGHLAVITLESLRAGRTEIWTPTGTKRLFTKVELS